MKNCKFCSQPAVILIQLNKMPLCKVHFISYIHDRVKKTINQYNLITTDDKVLVALSGGKDSQTLLTILHEIYNKDIQIEALYINVGVTPKNYSNDSYKVAKNLCDRLEIPLNMIDIRNELEFDMDSVHKLGLLQSGGKRRTKGGRFRGECSYCGLFKRYYINKFAVLNNFTKVATGHNLTDEATQLMGNFFNVDMELMSRAGPTTMTDVQGLITRIKPLYFIYEQEIIMYAYYANIHHLSTECEYATDSPSGNIKKSMLKIEEFRRGTMFYMVKKFQEKLKPTLFGTISEEKKAEKKCKECGMGTYMETCAFCRTKNRLQEQIQASTKLRDVDE